MLTVQFQFIIVDNTVYTEVCFPFGMENTDKSNTQKISLMSCRLMFANKCYLVCI